VCIATNMYAHGRCGPLWSVVVISHTRTRMIVARINAQLIRLIGDNSD